MAPPDELLGALGEERDDVGDHPGGLGDGKIGGRGEMIDERADERRLRLGCDRHARVPGNVRSGTVRPGSVRPGTDRPGDGREAGGSARRPGVGSGRHLPTLWDA